MSGYTLTQPELYYALPATVTTGTFTTATQKLISAIGSSSVPRCMVPANYFSLIGKAMRFEAYGTVSNLATGATFIMAAGLDAAAGTIAGTGGATLFTSAALTPTASVVCPIRITCDITCQAVGNLGTTLQVNAEAWCNNVASSGAWGTGTQAAMFGNNLTGVNNEQNMWLELFGTFTGTTTSCATVIQQFKVYLEN